MLERLAEPAVVVGSSAAASVIDTVVEAVVVVPVRDDQLLDRSTMAGVEQAFGERGVLVAVGNLPGELGQGRVPGDGEHDGLDEPIAAIVVFIVDIDCEALKVRIGVDQGNGCLWCEGSVAAVSDVGIVVQDDFLEGGEDA